MGPGRLLLAVLAVWSVAPAAPAQAEIPCVCSDRNGQHPLGAIVCMKVGEKERLVGCERNQNITSWRVLSEGCPTAAVAPGQTARPDGAQNVRL